MKIRTVIACLFAGVCLLVIAGCYGGSPSTNPDVSFTFSDDTTLPNVTAGGLLLIKADATAAGEGDVITTVQWTQESEVPGYTGVFSSDQTMETTWLAPQWAGADPLPVTLYLTVKTLNGGKTVKPLHLLINRAN